MDFMEICLDMRIALKFLKSLSELTAVLNADDFFFKSKFELLRVNVSFYRKSKIVKLYLLCFLENQKSVMKLCRMGFRTMIFYDF